MTRLCSCNNFKENSDFVYGRDCRICWLYHNDDRYKKLWDGLDLKQQIINFRKAVVRRVESNFVNVNDEDYKNRIKICERCPNKTDNWQCTQCGCFITIKARWASEDCPQNRWPLTITKEENSGDCNCGNKEG